MRLKPNLAEAHANRGNVLAALERRDEAVASYDRALAARGDFFEVHINRGNVLRLRGRPHEALAGYERAIALDDRHADAHFSRGLALEDLARFDAAIASYDRALALRPDGEPSFAGRVHAHRASALDQLGRFDEAFADADRSLQLAPDDHGIRYRLCFLDLLHGRWGEAWPRHESRIAPAGIRHTGRLRPSPLSAMGRRTARRRVCFVLRCEQGAGDRIQFCCFVPHLAERGHRIALWTNRLTELLQTVRGVEKVGAEFTDLAGSGRARWLHLMSLPLVLGTTPETVPRTAPYLAADATRVATWKERVGTGGFRIGIAWQGNPTYRQDKLRSIPLAAFAPLAEIPGVRLIALQKGYGSEQIGQVPFSDRIESLGDDFDTGPAFLDTAAVMMNLDLVISPNTAITHLAGALGRRVFVALNEFPDWRWLLGRDDFPWYPSARLFRQTGGRGLDGGGHRIAAAVRDMRSIADRDRHGPGDDRTAQPILAPIAIGELIDKITILEIKAARIRDPQKAQNVRAELDLLRGIRDGAGLDTHEMSALADELRSINVALWEIEDAIRACEGNRDFGPRFVELARSVYHSNDRRSAVKKRINLAFGSVIVEEKSYAGYRVRPDVACSRRPAKAKPPAESPPGVCQAVLRRSGYEVVLHPAEDTERVLVLDADHLRRVRSLRRGGDTEAREGGIQARPHDVHAEVEIRVRVPLGARADRPVAVVGIAVGDGEAAGSDRNHGHRERSGSERADQGLRDVAVLDVDVAAVQRGPQLRGPEMLGARRHAEGPGQLDLAGIARDRARIAEHAVAAEADPIASHQAAVAVAMPPQPELPVAG